MRTVSRREQLLEQQYRLPFVCGEPAQSSTRLLGILEEVLQREGCEVLLLKMLEPDAEETEIYISLRYRP